MSDKLILGVPSKGRLMEQTAEAFAAAGLTLRKTGNERGYRGEVVGFPDIEVAFISASEIAWYLKTGRVHLGVTGEDLVSEQMSDAASRVTFLKKLGFGRADVVVAVPDCWIDVRTMADLAEIALPFRRAHGRWYRVATKYLNITRRFFAAKGLSDYRIVESLGATEGTPAAGTAELIVDITTTGTTLAANGLRVLDDGVVLRSEANLIASNAAEWSPATQAAMNEIAARMTA
ncbi:MAG: ATP phosphoribosyltransferase [Hyphomicrobium zavarzinii]|jgi:ATP phosphoribosyltransferase|uniref:ATP phosphoribosyltransferase n=1 Tax=Hyphomicrobium TaxID=81 RepID=UPI000370E86A|nr:MULTISPECIES: ATP phosphoribosyltransferase [Hyphomicrobium]MBL8846170.1 ATP phosphoribosyltransferase [Hyphomicrobium zavarzinii]WBT38488.1 ATP phosphoribosyltransferase [Hyphomicrobium sp. DMF-1]HML44459.1 ATP phosphoribosyltransferase [Hyphomicrobium zavarzinii]